MWSFLVVAQLLCAAVLILSGIAKAREPEATQDAFTALRLPRALADSPAPALLPWAEIALGALLLVTRGWPLALGLLATLGLFLAYWVIIKRALGFAEPVSCNCFGKIGDHSVSPRTLVRNTLLVGTALAGLVGPLLGVSTLDLLLHRPEDLGWVLAAASSPPWPCSSSAAPPTPTRRRRRVAPSPACRSRTPPPASCAPSSSSATPCCCS